MSQSLAKKENFWIRAKRWAKNLGKKIEIYFSEDPGYASQEKLDLIMASSLQERSENLRAGATKIAQLEAYLRSNPLGELAKNTLFTMFSQLPSSLSKEQIHKIFQEDLNQFPEEIFSSFQYTPIASASIGQVHSAISKEGEHLAIKIQYPWAKSTLSNELESDLDRFAGLEFGDLITIPVKESLKNALFGELDFVEESKWLSRFLAFYKKHTNWQFPKPFNLLTSSRILTCTHVPGIPLSENSQKLNPSQRKTFTNALFFFVFESIFFHGVLNADPNPGNFLFSQELNQVSFVDFGCVVKLDKAIVQCEQLLFQSILAKEPELFRLSLHKQGLIVNPNVFSSSRYRSFEQLFISPYQNRHFLWTSSYAMEFTKTFAELVYGGEFILSDKNFMLWRHRLAFSHTLSLLAVEAPFRDWMEAICQKIKF